MDTDQANGTAEPKPKMRKIKKQVRKGDLPLSSGTASLDDATKGAAAERENAMFMEDKLVLDTEDKKNELESFIYELRGKIDEQYADFSSDEEKSKIKEKLEQSEVCILISAVEISVTDSVIQNWLYDEGEDATKAVYVAKIEEIRFVAGPIIQRYNDKVEEERQVVLRAQEEAAAAKQAEIQAKKKAEEEAKKAAEGSKDEEMKDADAVQPDGVEEAGDGK